jgi:hypothetical protein
VDEWQVEMQEIQRNLAGLRARQGDPVVIDELEAELRILKSLYATALDLFELGREDESLRRAFVAMGMGEWRFENVYSFVYERAQEIEPGRRELSSLVPELDYVSLILHGHDG